MERRSTAIILALVIGVSALTITGFIVSTNRADVRIGYLSQDLHQLAFKVALQKGWFAEANLTVDQVEYGNGADEMVGFQANQIDMGYLGVAPALTLGINSQIPVTLLAGVNYEGSALMVKKDLYDDGIITSVSDLVGKTIYYPGPSTVQSFLLRLALNQSGLSIADVNPQQIRPQDMAISLTDDAPAFIAWEPFPARAEADGSAVPLLLSGQIWPDHPCCVVAAANGFMKANPTIVQKVIQIHIRAEQWIVSHPNESIQIATDWLGMNENTVEMAFNRIIYDSALNRTGIEMYLRFLIEEDLVDLQISQMEPFLDGFLNQTFSLPT
jgi:NitT/TauT family transport system substrate-binding protein